MLQDDGAKKVDVYPFKYILPELSKKKDKNKEKVIMRQSINLYFI